MSMKNLKVLLQDGIRETKKHYEAPELIELGNVAELTNYDISTQIP